MKVDASLFDRMYSPPKTKPSSHRNKTVVSLKTKSAKMDRVDLHSGMSLERIQSMLQTEIGKKVDNMFAEAGIDIESAAGIDWSPEATSDRIFDMTTGLFGVWREQNKDMSESELIDSFEKVIRKSVDQGAAEAMNLIGAAGFGEETTDISEKTMSMLHEKYDDYFASLRDELPKNNENQTSGTQ